MAAALGIVAMLSAMLAAPAGAQLEDGTCPSSVDTHDEGWICSLLILDTPTDAPSDAQIQLWAGVLATDGRRGVTDGIVFSEAGNVRANILYEHYARRSPDAGGLQHWSPRAADRGLYATVVDFARSVEVVNTLGRIGMENATGGTSGSDPEQDLVVAPQEVVTMSPGEPREISVLGYRDGAPLDKPLALTLFPCPWATATESPVTFTDGNDDDVADGIASTIGHQAYISQVNGEPTGGKELYVDDATAASDGILRFTVVSPNPDCAVVAVLDDVTGDRQLNLDSNNHADEPFGVTEIRWQ